MEDVKSNRHILLGFMKDACQELGLKYEEFSQRWIIKISNQKKSSYIFGYSFPLNPQSSSRICKDKAATTTILNSFNIPNVQHRIFRSLKSSSIESWEEILDFLRENKKIVIKPNEGLSGRGVAIIENNFELESFIYKKIRERVPFALSPFVDIIAEYRVVVLNGTVQLIHKKLIPELVGNGSKTLLQLLVEKFDKIPTGIIEYINKNKLKWNYILQKNERIKINWKHNLSEGADIDMNIDEDLRRNISEMALKVADVLGMKFTSIDIIENSNHELLVIEVNSAVTLANFASKGKKEHTIVKNIYKEAIRLMMSER